MKIFTDFTAGELSPRLKGRFDLEIYHKGLSHAENVLPFLPGGMSIRPGFRFINDIGSSAVRLHGFIISESLSYIVEFSAFKIKIWKDGSPLEDENGVVELVTPFSDPWALQFAQDSADLYIASGTAAVQVLSMVSEDIFVFETLAITSNAGMIPFQSAGNYPRAIAIFDGRLWLAGTANDPQAIWASEPFDYGNFTFFDTIESSSEQMREPMRAFTGNRTSNSATITGISAEDLAGMRIGDTVFGTGIPYVYPDTITRIQEIGTDYIVMDHNATSSGTTGMYTGWHDRAVTEWELVATTRDVITSANAFKKTIACSTNETILWLAAGTDLVVGTNCSERIIPTGVTAPNFVCKLQTSHGSAPVQPVLLNDAVVFVNPSKDALREYVYKGLTSEVQAYTALRVDYMADHILSGIKELDFSSSGLTMLWIVKSSGELIALAHDRSMGINAFTRISPAIGSIESVCVISESGEDILYASINVSGARKLVRMDSMWSGRHLDFYQVKQVSGGAIDASWLSGSAVVVYDNKTQEVAIEAGSAAVSDIENGEDVVIGLPYTATLKTMPTASNPLQRKNVPMGVVKLYETIGTIKAGYGEALFSYSVETIQSSDLDMVFGGGWDREGIITIQASSLPFAVLALGLETIGG